jgi:DNA-directed RNA polymerase specialized sigma subunit
MRPRKEVLVGDALVLDFLSTKFQKTVAKHPLQNLVEEAVENMLTGDEQEIFWLRYGEGLPIRAIAIALGYTSHQIIQVKIARINAKVKEYLDNERTAS